MLNSIKLNTLLYNNKHLNKNQETKFIYLFVWSTTLCATLNININIKSVINASLFTLAQFILCVRIKAKCSLLLINLLWC